MAKSVLIIEDDAAVAELLKDLLEGEGHRVLMEADGEWGLRTFTNRPVDLVVLDVFLPKLVGFDLIERIRAQPKGKNVPIVVVSGVYRASAHRTTLVERYGILEYFDKPLDVDRFLYAVREVMKSSGPPTAAESSARIAATAVDELDAVLPTAVEPAPPASRGKIENIPFARLYGNLYAHRATGALMIQRSTLKKIVYLTQGIPTYVKSNLVSECLGRVMVRERIITERECEDSVRRIKREGRKQGELLVEMGSISPHNLQFGLGLQMEMKLFDLFSWLEGKYLFNEDHNYDGPRVPMSMSPVETILEGVRRTMSAERVLKDLGALLPRILSPTDDPTVRYQALQLEPRAEALLDAIDGTLTVRQVLDVAGFPRADAAMFVYAFTVAGLFAAIDRPVREIARPPELKVAKVDEDEGDALLALERARQKAARAGDAAVASAEAELAQEAETAAEIALRTAGIPKDPPPPEPVAEPAEPPLEVPALASAPPSFVGDRARLLEELEDRLEQLSRRDYYARLGVHRHASRSDLERAFKKLARELHPDHLVTPAAPRDARALAEEVFLLVRRAYETLTHDRERAEYDREIGADDDDAGTARLIAAEEAFARGLAFAEEGEWGRAEDELALAAERNPGESAYLANRAWAMFCARPESVEVCERAIADLDAAIDSNPRLEDAHVFRGLIAEKLGARDEAVASLRRAVAVNPDSVRALRALRTLAPVEKRSGLLALLGMD